MKNIDNVLLDLTKLNTLDYFSKQEMIDVLITKIQPLLKCQGTICGIGQIECNRIYIGDFLTADYSPEFINNLKHITNTTERHLMALWLDTQKPLWISSAKNSLGASDFEIMEMKKFGLCPMLIHGQRDLSGKLATYFSFSNCLIESAEEAKYIIHTLMPLLHNLLIRALEWQLPAIQSQHIQLTEVEWETVDLIKSGMSNKEIAKLRNKSLSTVNNQIKGIFLKFDVNSRTGLLKHIRSLTETSIR